MKQAGNTCKKRWTDESWDTLLIPQHNGLERFHTDTRSAEKDAWRDKNTPLPVYGKERSVSGRSWTCCPPHKPDSRPKITYYTFSPQRKPKAPALHASTHWTPLRQRGQAGSQPMPRPSRQMPPVPPRALSQQLPALTKANSDFLGSSQAKIWH